MDKLEKEKQIKKEVSRLAKQFAGIDPKKKSVVEKQINNAAYLHVSMVELQDSINENGYVDHYQNGANQFGTKMSPQVQILDSYQKQYTQVIRQLLDLLPKGEVIVEDDGFDEFAGI